MSERRHIGYGDHAAFETDFFTCFVLSITATIPALVMIKRDHAR